HACENNFLRKIRLFFSEFKEIDSCAHLHAFQHFLDNGSISADWNSLISVIKIVVVIYEAERKPFYDKRGRFGTLSAPWLFLISFDQFFINVPSSQEQRLLLQILRLCTSRLFPLFFYDFLCFGRSPDSPHFAECIHVKRQIVQFVPVYGNR